MGASSSSTSSSSSSSNTAVSGRVKMWPPWPFNLLLVSRRRGRGRRQYNDDDDDGDEDEDDLFNSNTAAKYVYPSTGALFWAYFTQQTRIGFRQLQELGSQLWFHTPPYFPPLVLFASIPRTIASTEPQQQIVVRTTIIPLFANPFVRNLCLWGVFISLMSWSHSELHRKRLLVPLPLNPAYRDINRAILPPFLPEQVPELDFVVLESTTVTTTTTAAPSVPELLQQQQQADATGSAAPYQHGENASQTVTSITASELPATTSTATTTTTTTSQVVVEDDEDGGDVPKSMKFFITSVPPRLRRHLKETLHQMMITTSSTTTSTSSLRTMWREWRLARQIRQLERQRLRRMAIFDELVALQKFKQQAKKRSAAQAQQQSNNNKDNNKSRQTRSGRFASGNQNSTESESSTSTSSLTSTPPLGYALVTGSSRGIGRAIAVELARWEIPLILVARDRTRLIELAYDLQACYGVKCIVLPADLSQPHAAQRIWETTRNAGLQVDILINNAGFSIHGLYVDTPLKDSNRMLQVIAVSVAELNQLYGRDMKEQGRGRILVVSSVNGDVAAGPTVALYSATKAFEKSLALSMAKELEPYGVGVTCLIPGAVRGTDFKAQSKTDEALCWKIPFYPLSPAKVAHQAVLGLLDGDVEVTPGWMNRVFLKMAKPILPQRIHNMAVEVAWNPLEINWPSLRRRGNVAAAGAGAAASNQTNTDGDDKNKDSNVNSHENEPQLTRYLPTNLNMVSPPRLLEIEDNNSFNKQSSKEIPDSDGEPANVPIQSEGFSSSSPDEDPNSSQGSSRSPLDEDELVVRSLRATPNQ